MDAPAPLPKRQRRNTKRAKLDNHQEQILTRLDQGQSIRSVAASLGTTHVTLCRWLDSIDQSKQELTRFRSTRLDALSSIQAKSLKVQSQILDDLAKDGLLATLTAAQKGNLLHSLVVANGNAYDKERLEGGQSTANHSIITQVIGSVVRDIYKPLKSKETGGTAPQEGAVDSSESSSKYTYAGSDQGQEASQHSDGGVTGAQGGNPGCVDVIASSAGPPVEKISA